MINLLAGLQIIHRRAVGGNGVIHAQGHDLLRQNMQAAARGHRQLDPRLPRGQQRIARARGQSEMIVPHQGTVDIKKQNIVFAHGGSFLIGKISYRSSLLSRAAFVKVDEIKLGRTTAFFAAAPR